MGRSLKYLLSFFKSSWTLNDYPIRYVRQDPGLITEIGFRSEGWESSRWRAQVEGWPLMFGLGETRQAAARQLQDNFSAYRESGDPLPRPGRRVMLTFPEPKIEQIGKYESISIHFMEHILKFHGRFWISDLSSIWDFPVEDTPDELVRKIALRYGVDVSDLIGAGNLVTIFKRIKSQGYIPSRSR